MNRFLFLAATLILTANAHAKLVVHEWGTFTSLVGSDGRAQNGMYIEDEPLPDFIYSFGDSKRPLGKEPFKTLSHLRALLNPVLPFCPGTKIPCEYLVDQLVTQKMETPVVYFYSDEAQKVNFDVSFPGGIISQSFPAPQQFSPQAIPGVELKNGFAHYEVNLLKDSSLLPPPVEATNIYSHARNTASDLIQVGGEVEKFIFYRGLGEFQTKLLTTSKDGTLFIENKSQKTIPAAFVISTDGRSRGEIYPLGAISANQKISVSSLVLTQMQTTKVSQTAFIKSARRELLAILTKAGLYGDEALSMIDTWENGYLKTPGLRVLYVLNESEVEEILPVQITPKPEELQRVFVGRIEVLLDTTENQVLSEIEKQGTDFNVFSLGSVAHPILLRVREIASEKGVLTEPLAQTIEALLARVQ